MNRCWLKAHWIVSAIVLISSSSTANPTANARLPDPQPRRRQRNRRGELWATFRKCSHGRLNETFLKSEIQKSLTPLASAAESRQGSSPLRGAPFVPHSASLTAFLATAQLQL